MSLTGVVAPTWPRDSDRDHFDGLGESDKTRSLMQGHKAVIPFIEWLGAIAPALVLWAHVGPGSTGSTAINGLKPFR